MDIYRQIKYLDPHEMKYERLAEQLRRNSSVQQSKMWALMWCADSSGKMEKCRRTAPDVRVVENALVLL